MDRRELTKKIKMKALELGFSKVGITTADDFVDYEREIRSRPDYDLWVNTERGAYLGTGSRPRSFYPEARSIVCAVYGFGNIKFPEALLKHVARAYLSRSYLPLEDAGCGLRVAALRNYLEANGCGVYDGNIDVPQRMACARAGIVTYGKNNFAYTEEDGSFIILYTFIVDRDLEYDAPTVERRCPENCRLCMDACPTGAILSPGRLHPQDCMLFNHIRRDEIPTELREKLGQYIHGCDVCQKACPRNRKVLDNASRQDPFLEKLTDDFDLEKVLALDEEYYRDVVHPIMYNYIRDPALFRRNAAIALGNSGDSAHIPALRNALKDDNPMVTDAAEWAISRIEKGIQI